MNGVRTLCLGFALAALGLAGEAAAGSYAGKISLVQVSNINGSETARFYVSAGALSLYASGVEQDVLRDAFMRKVTVSVFYSAMICPAGILGTCGLVSTVTVDAGNLP